MKKIYAILWSATLALTCAAAPLTPQEALQRAAGAADAPARLKGSSPGLQLVMTGDGSDGAAAYYVFSDNKETLFVSADDIARPILGYSATGNFSEANMPPQMKWWLGTYAAEIEYAKAHPRLVLDGSPKAPARVLENAAPIQPMVKTIWNQTAPFNDYCPVLDGERTVTGCVATSMAQVMNYWQWPEAEVSPISYEWKGQTLTSPATTIDWANMANSYNGNYSSAQADAVARLMQLAGYSVSMGYDVSSAGGSGAQSAKISSALVNKFGYDVGASFHYRDYYTVDVWNQMIYDNLANVGPVIYSGHGSAGGHSFVCDGYDSDGYFHINWGWGGMEDGYFLLSALSPGNLGVGGGAGGFNSSQAAVLGVQKPKDGSVAAEPVMGCDTSIECSTTARTLVVGATGEGAYYNISGQQGKIKLGVRLTNAETDEAYAQ